MGFKRSNGSKASKAANARTSKAPVRIVIKHRGVLGAFGYHDVASVSITKRRAALRKAAKALGWLYLVRKLNALYVFNKHRHPALAATFREDREYASARHRAEK